MTKPPLEALTDDALMLGCGLGEAMLAIRAACWSMADDANAPARKHILKWTTDVADGFHNTGWLMNHIYELRGGQKDDGAQLRSWITCVLAGAEAAAKDPGENVPVAHLRHSLTVVVERLKIMKARCDMDFWEVGDKPMGKQALIHIAASCWLSHPDWVDMEWGVLIEKMQKATSGRLHVDDFIPVVQAVRDEAGLSQADDPHAAIGPMRALHMVMGDLLRQHGIVSADYEDFFGLPEGSLLAGEDAVRDAIKVIREEIEAPAP